MEKLGEGHPPIGAAMVRSRWQSSFVTITTLLRMKMVLTGAGLPEPLDEG